MSCSWFVCWTMTGRVDGTFSSITDFFGIFLLFLLLIEGLCSAYSNKTSCFLGNRICVTFIDCAIETSFPRLWSCYVYIPFWNEMDWILNAVSFVVVFGNCLIKKLYWNSLSLSPLCVMCFFFPSKILLIQLLNYRLVEIGFRLGAQKDRWSRPSSTRAHSTAMKELLPRHPVGIRLTWAPRARICGLSLVPCRNLYPKRLSHYSGK